MKIVSKKPKRNLKKLDNVNPDNFIRRSSPIQKDAPDID